MLSDRDRYAETTSAQLRLPMNSLEKNTRGTLRDEEPFLSF